jgi:hypothetical protein
VGKKLVAPADPPPVEQPTDVVSGRDWTKDGAAVQAIAATWNGPGPLDASWIGDQWAATLSVADVNAIQATYPGGIGFYVAELLAGVPTT